MYQAQIFWSNGHVSYLDQRKDESFTQFINRVEKTYKPYNVTWKINEKD